jgi:hypothetical protein
MSERFVPDSTPLGLDADVILAAQAEFAGAVVVTTNVRHVGRLVPAKQWTELA